MKFREDRPRDKESVDPESIFPLFQDWQISVHHRIISKRRKFMKVLDGMVNVGEMSEKTLKYFPKVDSVRKQIKGCTKSVR